ncbi:hypothetical protein E2C01_095731 [Portunus trituberculatus]|uniref:Uncharacterized protein n=1 Tax=Portunus trituberculatus TaxID=210409 RepID=A0A5B7JZL0_PORTR|nr:hypothetical protein [Portunus trituberculatus]
MPPAASKRRQKQQAFLSLSLPRDPIHRNATAHFQLSNATVTMLRGSLTASAPQGHASTAAPFLPYQPSTSLPLFFNRTQQWPGDKRQIRAHHKGQVSTPLEGCPDGPGETRRRTAVQVRWQRITEDKERGTVSDSP